MVTLYRRPDDARADEIEDALDEDGEIVTGAPALRARLQRLR